MIKKLKEESRNPKSNQNNINYNKQETQFMLDECYNILLLYVF